MILDIVLEGTSLLREKSTEIPNGENLKEFVGNMWQTMYKHNGVGLAAPQVGKNISIFIVDTMHHTGGIRQAFVNAKIISSSDAESNDKEGCLSIPGVTVYVKRKKMIVLEYFDENFKQFKQKFFGFNARVIQHELDHIHGKLITDYK